MTSVRRLAVCTLLALFVMPISLDVAAQDAIPSDTFVMAMTGKPRSLDPANAILVNETRVASNIFEGLYMPPSGEGPVVPGVAMGYEQSDDGLTYTFWLRPEATWSNGDPVTAQDFVAAWLRIIGPESTSEYAYLMGSIRNAGAYHAGLVSARDVGVEAVDDHTLRVELEEPVPFFVNLTAFVTFFPVHTASIEALGDDAFLPANLVSNGAFQIDSFEGSALNLSQNEHYWDRVSVSLQHVSIRFYEDENASLAAYLDGSVEWLGEVPAEQVESVHERDDFHAHPLFGTYYFRINVTDPAFADPRVRRALSLAIDRDALCREALNEFCQQAISFVPPMPNFEPLGVLSFNPERAAELMLDAGYENGEGFPTVRVVSNALNLHRQVVEVISEMWLTHLGVHVEFVDQSWNDFFETLDTMDYHIARFGWIGDYLDPDAFLYLLVSWNFEMNGGWSNDGYDQLLRLASVERDYERRFDFYRAAEAILLNELPVIPLFYYTQYHLVNEQIHGLHMNLRDVHLARYISKLPLP